MRKLFLFFSMICLTAIMFTACTQKYPGYKKTPDGLYYKFYSNNATAVKPELTDFLKVSMACYLNDSLYFDWRESLVSPPICMKPTP